VKDLRFLNKQIKGAGLLCVDKAHKDLADTSVACIYCYTKLAEKVKKLESGYYEN